jgi:Flp pilus assembly protein TadG
MMKRHSLRPLVNQKGATLVLVAICLVVLIGFAAIAVDLAYLYIVKGELQNAADSGALAGAQVLYNNAGTSVNAGANVVALNYVNLNYSEQASVQAQSVERGHWSFATRTFTPNDSTAPVSLWNATSAELDANTDFINAVRVITTRKIVPGTGMPEEPFFARIWGTPGTAIQAVAVAYLGFAGTVESFKFDLPIAICQEALLKDGEYSCTVGRMINSGNSPKSTTTTGETGGWTSFEELNTSAFGACSGGGAGNVKDLFKSCVAGNPTPLLLGNNIKTSGGQDESAFTKMFPCWNNATDKNKDGIHEIPWKITLPVIQCCATQSESLTTCNNPGPCNPLKGAVVVEIVWMQDKNDSKYEEVPFHLIDWSSTEPDGAKRWNELANHFQLKGRDGVSAAPYVQKTMYFKPNCEPHIPMGGTGGENFGILAKIPVLVK